MTLDVTTGSVNSVDITVPGVGEFDRFPQVYALHSNVEFEAVDANGDTLDLYITAANGSFEGFSGGTIYGNLIDLIRGGLLGGLTGDVTPPAVAVATPEPSSLVVLAGALGCLGLAARRARRRP